MQNHYISVGLFLLLLVAALPVQAHAMYQSTQPFEEEKQRLVIPQGKPMELPKNEGMVQNETTPEAQPTAVNPQNSEKTAPESSVADKFLDSLAVGILCVIILYFAARYLYRKYIRSRPIKPDKKGFTLVEMILVILFISIALFGVMYVLTRSIYSSAELEGNVKAINLATQKIEQLYNQSFGSMTSEAKANISGFNGYQRSVSVSTAEADLDRIVITIYWTIKGQAISYEVTTLRSNVQ